MTDIQQCRVLLIGKTGCGKTTILSKLCGEDVADHPVAHEPGQHNIEKDLILRQSNQLVAHDSEGFEAGTEGQFDVAMNFIKHRGESPVVGERLHIIWYCMELESHLIQAAERRFFGVARTTPVIAVITKFDDYIDSIWQDIEDEAMRKKEATSFSELEVRAVQRAKQTFNEIYRPQLMHLPFPPDAIVVLSHTHKATYEDPCLRRLVQQTSDILTLQDRDKIPTLPQLEHVQNQSGDLQVAREASYPIFDSADESSDYSRLQSPTINMKCQCDIIRILLVGKAGSGKSTLVSKVFGFDLHQARVQSFRSGEHNIDQEITSPDSTITPTLRLHDSKGLESGSEENLRVILNFVRSRQDRPLAERLHAIWYCVEIPTAGQRPFEGGDINLLNSLKQCEVPVIIVFTKFDRLKSRERNRLTREYMRRNMNEERAIALAGVECEVSAKTKFRDSCVTFLGSRLGCASWTTYCVVSQKDEHSIIALIEKTKAALKESEVLKVI